MHTANSGPNPVVEAHDLRKAYGEFEAVRGIDFTIEPGERFGFLGPNGAGKTTTMKMIYAFSPVTAGTLNVFGLDIAKQARAIKARLGVVPQHDNLDRELTLEENLVLYARFFGIRGSKARDKARELLDFMALSDWADRRPTEVSGGMRRRVVIARALVNDPELVILDEPTTGLDPQVRRLVWDKLRSLEKKGVTLILTTHYMEEAERLCDRLVVMNQGEILARGHASDLVSEFVGHHVAEIQRAGDALGADVLEEFTELVAVQTDRTAYVYDPPRDLIDSLTDHGELTVTVRPANLEDVFLRLSGHQLSE
jgi:lipooligosaccharide transport system ATP-binding protein